MPVAINRSDDAVPVAINRSDDAVPVAVHLSDDAVPVAIHRSDDSVHIAIHRSYDPVPIAVYKLPAPTKSVMPINVYIHLLIRFCGYLLILRSAIYSNGYGANVRVNLLGTLACGKCRV